MCLHAEHSDPDRMRELAQRYSAAPSDGGDASALAGGSQSGIPTQQQQQQQSAQANAAELAMQRKKVKETMQHLSSSQSEKELMEAAIAVMNSEAATADDVANALADSLELVEQVDNANDFFTLGGVSALALTLRNFTKPDVLDAALHVLGTAWYVPVLSIIHPMVSCFFSIYWTKKVIQCAIPEVSLLF